MAELNRELASAARNAAQCTVFFSRAQNAGVKEIMRTAVAVLQVSSNIESYVLSFQVHGHHSNRLFSPRRQGLGIHHEDLQSPVSKEEQEPRGTLNMQGTCV